MTTPARPTYRRPLRRLAIIAALVAVAAVVYTIAIAPKRTERLPERHQPTEGQGEELTPRDRAA